MSRIRNVLFAIATSLVAFAPIEGGWVIENGEFHPMETEATGDARYHMVQAELAREAGDWKLASQNYRIVLKNFPHNPLVSYASLSLAVCDYELGHYDSADRRIAHYLRTAGPTEHYSEAWTYRFKIAEAYRQGAKKHLLGQGYLPKVLSGKTTALEIYDEVMEALPGEEVSVQALYSKAALLSSQGEAREAISTYESVIRRYPQHNLAPKAYLAISRIYETQNAMEPNNPDPLILADINLRRFEKAYPRDPSLVDIESGIAKMQNIYAGTMYDTGRFYEKTKRPEASVVYYAQVMQRYPKTAVANQCKERLEALSDVSEAVALLQQLGSEVS